MSGNRQVEKAQQKQLILYYQQFWLSQYSDLRVTMINNDGIKHIIDAMEDKRMGLEAGHPDLLWRIKFAGHYHYFYHELKKLKGTLSSTQKDWWSEFTPTEFVKGAITYGWEAHLEAVQNWLKDFIK